MYIDIQQLSKQDYVLLSQLIKCIGKADINVQEYHLFKQFWLKRLYYKSILDNSTWLYLCNYRYSVIECQWAQVIKGNRGVDYLLNELKVLGLSVDLSDFLIQGQWVWWRLHPKSSRYKVIRWWQSILFGSHLYILIAKNKTFFLYQLVAGCFKRVSASEVMSVLSVIQKYEQLLIKFYHELYQRSCWWHWGLRMLIKQMLLAVNKQMDGVKDFVRKQFKAQASIGKIILMNPKNTGVLDWMAVSDWRSWLQIHNDPIFKARYELYNSGKSMASCLSLSEIQRISGEMLLDYSLANFLFSCCAKEQFEKEVTNANLLPISDLFILHAQNYYQIKLAGHYCFRAYCDQNKLDKKVAWYVFSKESITHALCYYSDLSSWSSIAIIHQASYSLFLCIQHNYHYQFVQKVQHAWSTLMHLVYPAKDFSRFNISYNAYQSSGLLHEEFTPFLVDVFMSVHANTRDSIQVEQILSKEEKSSDFWLSAAKRLNLSLTQGAYD
ncbi:hypothetical protein MMH89_03225 [Candidatus Comchoanobacter bicostacola]|uniref:Uncharacterized protein n=1 Tax=Candidatus Comchoanobacter bicostacola TaxID=2919598 RepID=A0ABY5DK22_9GAMM|nr:hypothetical protein [Candidatus Comchoanobacter bicostacola]UTC24234.1 hypothetical protein MMH89_03225 [Candidatus Comchoanobacter bicostacola]